jgi:PAS domain S-box-containing protein
MDVHSHSIPGATDSPWALFDSLGTCVAVTRPDGILDFCNASLLQLTGQSAVTLLGSSIFSLLDSANGELQSLHHAVLATHIEQRAQVRSSRGTFVATAILRRLDRHDGQRVVWSFVDVGCSVPVPELALWGTEIGLWDWDVANDRMTWINDWCEHSQVAAFSGTGHQQLWSARIHPEDLPAYRCARSTHLDGQTPSYDVEYRLRNRGDAWVWIQERGRVIERDPAGHARRVVGLCLDVDERHNTAHALERSESRFAHAVWGTSIGFWDLDIATDVVHWWNDWCATVDLDPCEGANHGPRWDAEVHPDDLLPFNDRHLAVIEGRSDIYEAEYRMRTRSGDWRWILSRGRATARDNSGRAIRLAGVTIDIDARKRTELALRDSEARLEAAIWGADLGLWDWKLEDNSLMWLSDWPTRHGVDAAARIFRREEWLARVHPLDQPKYAAEDRALIHDGRNSADSDYRVLSSRGDWRWVNVRTRVIERNAEGRARRIVGACIDVDSRRRAEQLLRTQAMILETMREAVILADLNGLVEFTNRAFDRMFGREPHGLAGTSVMDLLNTDQNGQSPALGIEGVLDQQDGRSGKRDMLFRRRDGTQFAGEVLFADLEWGGEKKTLIVVQDVSERKQLEAEIIEVANQERRRLAGDLHDGLGQELTGISLMLRSLATRRGLTAVRVAPELNEIIALVNHAIQSVRKMALGISPVTLERGGLLVSLQTLTCRCRDSYSIDVQLRLMIRSPLRVDESTATHLYLIAQEAINNAVKHGHARSVIVKLRTSRHLAYLSITDDGGGLANDQEQGAGLGLKIMEYRAAMIGGVIQIKSLPNGGTQLRGICPQNTGAVSFEPALRRAALR